MSTRERLRRWLGLGGSCAPGIRPDTRKAQTRDLGIRRAPLPPEVSLALNDNSHKPWAETLLEVNDGDWVRAGQRIARPVGHLALPMHAPISGRVNLPGAAAITSTREHASDAPGIVIVAEGCQQILTMRPLAAKQASPEQIFERIAEAGIAGMGGAGFPAALKARAAHRAGIDTLLINAAECEPYITADDALLRHDAEKVVSGALILARATGATRIVAGIEDDKPEAAEALSAALAMSTLPTDVVIIPTRYPSGGERQLIDRLLARRMTPQQLPVDVGVLCHNPATLAAIHDAVILGLPAITRIVTLAGQALSAPGNVEARVGTPAATLLADAGLDTSRLAKLIDGGPLMGHQRSLASAATTPTTHCLIAATEQELPSPPPPSPCIRCNDCVPACPAGLAPQQLWWHTRVEDDERAKAHGLLACIECGACDYVCPSHLPLAASFGEAKRRLRVADAERARADQARARFDARKERMQREHDEREARRQARKAALRRPAPKTPADDHAPTSSAPADLRSLRIAQAAAKAALRKAEKALERAAQQQQPSEVLADLESQQSTAREHLEAANAQLAAARQEAPTS